MKKLLIGILAANLVASSPMWFAKPTMEPSKVYGFGIGTNPQSSKQNAILDLANSLQSSVKSNFDQETVRRDNTINSSASQKMTISTKGIDLSGVTVAKSECYEGQCYTQVEILKSVFLKQLASKIETDLQEFARLNSPFDYQYKKEVLLPTLLANHALYMGLGGSENLKVPSDAGEKPAFEIQFIYGNGYGGYYHDHSFSPAFREVLKKEVQKKIAQFGTIVPRAEWKLIITAIQEEKTVTISSEFVHNDTVVHSASIYDTQKKGISSSFFAQRLATQLYKAMQKWSSKK